MSDFLCGVMLELDEVDGRNCYFKAKQWDKPLFNSFTLSDYIANTTRTQIYQLAFILGEQTDGRFLVTASADIPTWVADDRAMCKVGSSINSYAATATCAAAMNGTTDRMLVCYSDTSNNPAWYHSVIAASTGNGYNISGVLPHCRVVFLPGNAWYTMTGDMSGVADVDLDNFTYYPGNGGSSLRYTPSVDLTGRLRINRVICQTGRAWSMLLQGGSDKIQIYSCLFTGGNTMFYVDAVMDIQNCTFVNTYIDFNAKAATMKNCAFIDSAYKSDYTNVVPTNCQDTSGLIGTSTTHAAMKTWTLNAEDGAPLLPTPSAASSSLIAAGAATDAPTDLWGRDWGATPAVGCSEVQEMVASSGGGGGPGVQALTIGV